MTDIKSVCVFCGSSIGAGVEYSQSAVNLGAELARNEVTLVYGGGSTGLMGLMADSALKYGGKVIGIIPKALRDREIQHTGLAELHVVDSMHTRKAMMAQLSDAFVALPGGFGTYEELFEVITWAQLGIHKKPILILNTAGFYDPFFEMVRHSVEEGFIRPMDPGLIRTTTHYKEVLTLLNEKPEQDIRPKWMDLKES